MLSDIELEAIFDGLTGKDKSEKVDPVTRKTVSAKSYAISMIYKKFQPIVYKKMRYQFFRSISENDAQDIVQDAFLKIYITTSLPRSFEVLPSWVCKFAENNALDLFKKAYVKNELDEYGKSRKDFDGENQDEHESISVLAISEDEIRSKVFVSKAGEIRDFNDQINRDVEGCVSDGMKVFGVEHPQRELTLSLLMDGKTTNEIAMVLERTVSATWVYIHECKKKLSPYIKHCLERLD